MLNKNIYSLVLGGYINGYSIIRELHEKGLGNIAIFDYGRSLSKFSNKINYYDSFDKANSESLKKSLFKLKEKCDYVVIFPTDDLQLENLHAIYHDIKEFCFVPFNYDNILESLDKSVQYKYCEEYGIPYPKTENIESMNDLAKIETMMFPVLIKPNKRDDLTTDVFRSLFLNNVEEYHKNKLSLKNFINNGTTFLASEFIPGDDTNIYAYVGYRSQNGEILNEWIGKKLTQYPDNFGVFSSGTNEAPDIVREQGRKLLEVMNLKGINEPEFKYDRRDGQYKLMEINLRSMMWHRVGNLSGVNIQYTQYLDAVGENTIKQQQDFSKRVHFIYMQHELLNLAFRKSYWKHFNYNVFGGYIRGFAVYCKGDKKPFFYNGLNLVKGFIGRCLKVLKIR